MNENFIELNKKNNNKKINEMKEYSKVNKVPIVSDEGLSYILLLIRLMKTKNILEIGSAIGYCAANMALENENILVDTIEKEENMYNEAIKNIKDLKLEARVNIILSDALEFNENTLNKKYDLIFIDAAKAQYAIFFEKYGKLLNDNGIIICDNLLFHGLVESNDFIENRNIRALVRKIKRYNLWLANNEQYDTTFLRIGDGMSISTLKK